MYSHDYCSINYNRQELRTTPTTDERRCSLYTYGLVKDEFLLFVTIWMYLESMMPGELSYMEKDKYHFFVSYRGEKTTR